MRIWPHGARTTEPRTENDRILEALWSLPRLPSPRTHLLGPLWTGVKLIKLKDGVFRFHVTIIVYGICTEYGVRARTRDCMSHDVIPEFSRVFILDPGRPGARHGLHPSHGSDQWLGPSCGSMQRDAARCTAGAPADSTQVPCSLPRAARPPRPAPCFQPHSTRRTRAIAFGIATAGPLTLCPPRL